MNNDDKKMLEEVEKLDAEATPGPWVAGFTDSRFPESCQGIWPKEKEQINDHGEVYADRADEIVTTDSGAYGPSAPDAIFITRARSLLPALARRLREALAIAESDEEALSLASSAGYETARREAIAAISALPEWPVVDAHMKERSEVERLVATYPVKVDEDLVEYVKRVGIEETTRGRGRLPPHGRRIPQASPFPPSSHDLKPTRSLEELIEATKRLPPMTIEERVEQKISWVFGQIATESGNHLSKGEVAGIVYKKAFEEVLADLRVAVASLRRHSECGSELAVEALAALKTGGL